MPTLAPEDSNIKDYRYLLANCQDLVFYKNGKIKDGFTRAITWLNKCDCCGYVSTPKKVQYRSLLNVFCCMKCFNKLKALDSKEKSIKQTQKFINKTREELKQWQRSQTLAN